MGAGLQKYHSKSNENPNIHVVCRQWGVRGDKYIVSRPNFNSECDCVTQLYRHRGPCVHRAQVLRHLQEGDQQRRADWGLAWGSAAHRQKMELEIDKTSEAERWGKEPCKFRKKGSTISCTIGPFWRTNISNKFAMVIGHYWTTTSSEMISLH